MKKKVWIVLFLSIYIFTMLENALAYNLTGKKWADPKTPKYYWVSGFPSDLQTAANNAAKSWMNASSKLSLTYNNSGTVALTSTYNSKSNLSGYTTLQTDFGGLGNTIIGARVIINTYVTNKYNSTQKQSVLGHEFGHVWGLGDSGDLWALMYPSDEERNYRGTYLPRSDDIAGINAIYP
ncbi:matrixin family metalloprotease [Carboxydocella sp. JDF658]|uniref:matrixin family metalloprotease n=1 Tax=Carboxydocella sp. JDF658 TaxID=1926600 RepID=UPI0009ABF72E|nr:matrixin family metalloprotease [Carboxydocella sp. JDF658]GAW30478.1 hypothetical protein JDF658_02430 [Carboxydocella sp. JDF658]